MQIINLYQKIEEPLSMCVSACSEASIHQTFCSYQLLQCGVYIYKIIHNKYLRYGFFSLLFPSSILVIFRFWGYFGHFLGIGDILVIFRFRGNFGHFLDFGDILVIFQVLVVFWSFSRFWGYFGLFLGLEVFRSFQRFHGIFGNFRSFKLFVSIFEVLGLFGSFQRFRGIFVTLYV